MAYYTVRAMLRRVVAIAVVGCGTPAVRHDRAGPPLPRVELGACAAVDVPFVSGAPEPFDDSLGMFGALIGGAGPPQSGPGNGRLRVPVVAGDSNAPTARVLVGQPRVTGGLDPAIVRRYVRRRAPMVTYCYEKQLMVNPSLEGTVATHFAIGPDGVVVNASANGFDPDVAGLRRQRDPDDRLPDAAGPSRGRGRRRAVHVPPGVGAAARPRARARATRRRRGDREPVREQARRARRLPAPRQPRGYGSGRRRPRLRRERHRHDRDDRGARRRRRARLRGAARPHDREPRRARRASAAASRSARCRRATCPASRSPATRSPRRTCRCCGSATPTTPTRRSRAWPRCSPRWLSIRSRRCRRSRSAGRSRCARSMSRR